MANGSLHRVSISLIGINFLGFDQLLTYLKLFYVSRIAVVVGDGVPAAYERTDIGHKLVRKP